MKIWRLEHYKGQQVLVPRKNKSKIIKRAFAIASAIPGAKVNMEDGEVMGGPGALAACLEAAGQELPEGLSWGVEIVKQRKREKALGWDCLAKFQREGARFMSQRIDHGVLNNDDMGLGKTVQSIATFCSLDQDVKKIILCPAFLRPQWKEEIERWAPKLGGGGAEVQIIWPKSDRRSTKGLNPNAEWVIAYYSDAERAMEFVGYDPYFLLVDEVHNLRGLGSKRYEEVEAISVLAQGRIGLTASETYNAIASMWQIYNIVSPGHWGPRGTFLRRHAGAYLNEFNGLELPKGEDGEHRIYHVDELNKRRGLHGFRRIKEDVWDQLPFDTKFQVVWLDPPFGAGDSIKGAMMGGIQDRYAHLERVSMFKVPSVVELVRGDTDAGLPSLTFTYLKKQALALANDLKGALLVTGDSTSAAQRLSKINAYVARCKQEKRAPHVVATMDALSEGVNAQWAKVVNFAALDHKPDKLRQCLARAARMGQEGTVTVRIIACRSTIDEHIAHCARETLRAQFRLDGRKEKGKGDLEDALSPPGLKDALATIYERYMAMEKSGQ